MIRYKQSKGYLKEFMIMARCEVNLKDLNEISKKVTYNMANDIDYEKNMVRDLAINKVVELILNANKVIVDTSKENAEAIQSQIKVLMTA